MEMERGSALSAVSIKSVSRLCRCPAQHFPQLTPYSVFANQSPVILPMNEKKMKTEITPTS